MASIAQRIRDCTACTLHNTCTHKVVGAGSSTPKIVVIGEAPGAEEDKSGIPFVGSAGRIIRPLLDSLGLEYTLLNLVKCRPPNNRTPTMQEVTTCMPFLHEQIERLRQPGTQLRILLLGKTAYTYCSRDAAIRWAGRPCKTIYGPGFALYHPAAILHDPSKKEAFETGWYDFKASLDLVPPRIVQPFVHLHMHTEYSYRDSTNKLEPLIESAARKGFKHLAITDHYHMAGIFKFYSLCKEYGINPILGIEANYARNLQEEPGHMTILAKSYKGLQNLFRAIYLSAVDSYSIRKPKDHLVILEKHLFDYNEDIFVLSGCLASAIIKIEHRDPGYIKKFKAVFKDRFFLEVIPTEVMFDRIRELNVLSKQYGVRLVTTNDAHFIDPGWRKTWHLLVNSFRRKDITHAPAYDGPYYLKTWDEMLLGLPEDIAKIIEAGQQATLDIAEQVRIEIPTNPHLPSLHGNTIAQFRSLLPPMEKLHPTYQARVKRELEIIESKGFQTYFLMIYGIVNFARSRGIEIESRGSVGGSLIAYLLKWTNVDPVKHDIMFERFLSPDRIGLPDIDLDVDTRYRADVIDEYIKPTYGEDFVAYHTIQPSRFQRKTAIQDVGRFYRVDYRVVDIAKASDDLSTVEAWPEEATDHVFKLEGQIKTSTVHSGAVIVADKPLCEYAPTEYRSPKQGKKGEYVLTVGTDHESCERIGLVKFDLLCQKCLSVIKECYDMIPLDARQAFDEINTSDQKVWLEYAAGRMAGIFQVEGINMTEVIKEVCPKNIGELADCIALYRPGAIQANFLKMYLENAGNPMLSNWCGYTRNCVLYQEQVMAIFHGMGGLPMTEVDKARRIISKKKKGELEKMEERFVIGAVQRGYLQEHAQAVFTQLVNFSGYAFNKAHAYLYAMRSYRMMWLKVNFPVEYAIASMRFGDPNLGSLIVELRERGIVIEDPDINVSQISFTKGPTNNVIGALTAVSNINQVAAEKIVANRPYTNIQQLEALLTQTQLISLAKSRALRSIYPDHRKAVILATHNGNLPLAYENKPYSALESYLKRSEVVDYPSYQHPLDEIDLSLYTRIKRVKDVPCVGHCVGLVRDVKTDNRRSTVIVEDTSGTWKMSCWQNGQFNIENMCGHMAVLVVHRSKYGLQIVDMYDLDVLEDEKDNLSSPAWGDDQFGTVSGDIVAVEVFKTKASREMAVLYLENMSGGGKLVVFPSDYEKYKTGCKRWKRITNLSFKLDKSGDMLAQTGRR